MPIRPQWIPSYVLAVIWLIFIVRGIFYCHLIPLWEGYDEWSHYAFIQHVNEHRSLPRASDPISDELRQSVNSGPVFARHMAGDSMRNYEAQQPPLYYWLMTVPNRLWHGAPIAIRAMRLRIFSVAIASLVIPLVFFATRKIFPDPAIGLIVCALVASMPGLMLDVARIGNDSLAMALGSWMIFLLLRRDRLWLGIAFGLALLTKAYFLALIPVLAWRRRFSSLAIAVLIGGWWYARTILLTGSLSGEQLDAEASRLGWGAKFSAALHLNWIKVLDSAAWTHIWCGGWSFLTLRSWMYHSMELLLAIAAVGALWAAWREHRALNTLIAIELCFAAGIAYHSLAIFMTKDVLMAPGWYFYSFVGAETLLIVAGVVAMFSISRAHIAIATLILLFAALDVYGTVGVLARHYATTVDATWSAYFATTLFLPALTYTLRSFVTRPTSTHSTTKIFPA